MTNRLDTDKASDTIVKVESLSIGYWAIRPILENLNFTIDRGDIFMIIGDSGCGKSSLLKTLIGLEDNYKGNVWVDGGKPSLFSPERFRKTVGVLFQKGGLFSALSVLDNVALPVVENIGDKKNKEEYARSIARNKLEITGLHPDDYNKPPTALSGGMIKRVALARALALDPHLIFLDEPSAGLDPISASKLDDLIIEISHNSGATTIIVTHDLGSIEKISSESEKSKILVLSKRKRSMIAQPKHLKLLKEDLVSGENIEESDRIFVEQFINRQS